MKDQILNQIDKALDWYSKNYKDEPCQQNIKTFETAEEAIRFYNENNR